MILSKVEKVFQKRVWRITERTWLPQLVFLLENCTGLFRNQSLTKLLALKVNSHRRKLEWIHDTIKNHFQGDKTSNPPHHLLPDKFLRVDSVKAFQDQCQKDVSICRIPNLNPIYLHPPNPLTAAKVSEGEVDPGQGADRTEAGAHRDCMTGYFLLILRTGMLTSQIRNSLILRRMIPNLRSV